MVRAAHKASRQWHFHLSHGSHAARKAGGVRSASSSSSLFWQRSSARHAVSSAAFRPTLAAGAAGVLAAAALALTGALSAGGPARRRASFSLMPSGVASASRSSSRSPLSSWSLDSAGEFDTSRAFSKTDQEKINDAVQNYKPQPAFDQNGRSQFIGISAHQSNVNGDFDGYGFSECTWWAAVRRAQLGHPVPQHMGNGGQWADSARANHMAVDSTPQVGDVAVFEPGQAAADLVYGHVAVVEAVLSDGSIIISESSASYHGQIHARRIWDASRYQYSR